MALGGLAPLFLLWAIRGTSLVPRLNFILIMLALAALPNLYVYWRITRESKRKYTSGLKIVSFEDKKDGVLIYLVSILLPFYSSSMSTWPELISSVAALVFIVVVFIYLDLHYVNIMFAITRFNIFLVRPDGVVKNTSSRHNVIVITKQTDLREGSIIQTQKVTSRIYVEGQGTNAR